MNKRKNKSLATPRVINLLKYIEEGNATDDYTRKLDVEVSKVKKDEGWRKTYMVYEKNINYAREEERQRFQKLIKILVEEKRLDDLKKIAEDDDYLKKLLDENDLK